MESAPAPIRAATRRPPGGLLMAEIMTLSLVLVVVAVAALVDARRRRRARAANAVGRCGSCGCDLPAGGAPVLGGHFGRELWQACFRCGALDRRIQRTAGAVVLAFALCAAALYAIWR